MTESQAPVHPRVNIIGVVMSLAFMVVASVGLTGNPWWLLDPGTKWLVAGGIALIGLGLVASTLPRRRRT